MEDRPPDRNQAVIARTQAVVAPRNQVVLARNQTVVARTQIWLVVTGKKTLAVALPHPPRRLYCALLRLREGEPHRRPGGRRRRRRLEIGNPIEGQHVLADGPDEVVDGGDMEGVDGICGQVGLGRLLAMDSANTATNAASPTAGNQGNF